MKNILMHNVTHDELKKEFQKYYNLEYGQFEEAVNYLLQNKDFFENGEYIRMTGDKNSVIVDTIGVAVPDHSFDIELKERSIIKLGNYLKLEMNKF